VACGNSDNVVRLFSVVISCTKLDPSLEGNETLFGSIIAAITLPADRTYNNNKINNLFMNLS
jgi:hypothetical protein